MTESATRTDTSQGPASRLGAELTAARRGLGWELPQLATSLRIRQSYLEAIEAGDISQLPGTTYALGFVRAYAAALGLPGEEIARRFRAEAEEVNGQPTLRFPAPVPRRGVPAGALMLLGLVILAGAYGGWFWITEHRATKVETVPPIPDRLDTATQKSTPSPAVASLLPSTGAPAARPPAPAAPEGPAGAAPQPVPSTAAPPSLGVGVGVAAPGPNVPPTVIPAATVAGAQPAAGAPGTAGTPASQSPSAVATAPPPAALPGAPSGTRIVVKASADAWVTVKQPVGPPVLNKLLHAGDSWPVPPDAKGLLLTTGNAGGTAIEVDGAPIPTSLGGSGAVRRDVPLDANLLKSGQLPPLKARTKPKAPPE